MIFTILVIGGQEDVLSAGSTPAKPPATMTNNYNTKLELPSQLPGLSATGGTGPPPTSLGGQLNAGVGGPGPPSPRGLTAMANPLNPASPRPITPGILFINIFFHKNTNFLQNKHIFFSL
jgi:hypothetical protein